MRAPAVRLALTLTVAAAAAFAADPVLGTWDLDLSKSTYSPGPAPASQTRVYAATPGGIKVTITTTSADGKTTIVEHPANFDGKDYPIVGTGQISAISLKQVDPYSSEASIKHGHLTVGTVKRVVAKDGRTMTVTYRGSDNTGRQLDNVSFYKKR